MWLFWVYRQIVRLPWSWLTALGGFLGQIAIVFAKERTRIATVNLQLCFPSLGPTERQQLVKQHFMALGMGLMDTGLAWWATDARLRPWFNIRGSEHVVAALQRGHGVIFVTAHFVALEMGGRALRSICPLYPMYRPHRNHNLECLVMTQRRKHTEWVIPRNDVRLLLRTLEAGLGVFLVVDQNFGHKSHLFAPFFGIPAATTTVVSRFAKVSGAAVVPLVVLRRENAAGYDIIIEPALEGFPSADLQQDTNRINAIIERWVRQAPTQYLWTHRRFKNQPAGANNFY